MITPVVIILFAVFYGCDGGKGGANSVRDQLEASVREYTVAFGEGDADAAWALVSERCKVSLNEMDYRATVEAAGELYDSPEVDRFAAASLADDHAYVDYYVSEPGLSQSRERWALESDEWRWDDC